MANVNLNWAGFGALSRSKNDIENFDAAEIPEIAEELHRLLKEMTNETDANNAFAKLGRYGAEYFNASARAKKDLEEKAKADIESLSKSMELAREAVVKSQRLFSRLAHIEKKIGNDNRVEMARREALFTQEIRHTRGRKNVDVAYAIAQRMLSTASVILVVMALLWIAKTIEAPIPAVLAPVPADKHFSEPKAGLSIHEPGSQIDIFLNKLWK